MVSQLKLKCNKIKKPQKVKGEFISEIYTNKTDKMRKLRVSVSSQISIAIQGFH